jgi:two-component system KDP operon response regulator KdpE
VSATGRRVLAIDDEPQIRKFLRISLGAQGYEVVEAATAAEGVRRCSADQPDLIVLDLGLPDQDGLRCIPELRRLTDAPIIVLSVRADEQDKVAALDAGANDYVTKPFGIEELVARVRVALRVRRTRRARPRSATDPWRSTSRGAASRSTASRSSSPRPSSTCSRC